MFSWATNKLETLAQTVAPPPADPTSRFLHACQRGKEQEASSALEEMTNPLQAVVVPAKSQGALLVACLYGLPDIVDKVVTIAIQQQQTFDLMQVLDIDGNNPLHCACMSNQTTALQVVKYLLEKISKAAVGTKNNFGQTPYDVAALDSVRQFLLPIQLQAETQAALANGGAGLPPGIDLCGLKVSNPNLAPPPTMPAPAAAPAAAMTPPPIAQPPRSSPESGNRPPSAPTSGSQYAYRGGSSAAMKTVKGITPDGFHSSSSDKNLQEKYGHQAVGYGSAIPPPPSSGNSLGSMGASPMSAMPPPPNSGGPNPYSAGLALGGAANRRALRYVAFDPINGASPVPAAPSVPPPSAAQRVASAPTLSTFMPPPPAMSIPTRGSSVTSTGGDSVGPASPMKSFHSQGSFSNPPTPNSNTFSNPPTPSSSAFPKPPTPSAAFSNPTPTSGNSFTSPPTPSAAFSNPPPTPSATFSNPPTPSAAFSNPPTSGNSFTNPPTPSNAFSNPPTPSATFASPPTPPSSQGASFPKPPAASAVFGTPPQATEDAAAPAAASSLFARPPTMTSLPKPPTPTAAAVDAFTKPPAASADSMFSQPPPGASSSPTKIANTTTTEPTPEPQTPATPAVPPQGSVEEDDDDDEGDMDEVPLTPGQNEPDDGAAAAAADTPATGMPLPPLGDH